MIDSIKTGEYISRLRKEHDMTQLSLATALKVTHQAISKWETGNALPDIELLLALSKLFDVSIESLLIGEEIENEAFSACKNDIPEDKLIYSETMAEVIKTQRNIPMLIDASEEMLDKDITDCIQTMGIHDESTFLKLSKYISSASMAQIIKTFKNASLLMLLYEKMDANDIKDCVQTLSITSPDDIKKLMR